MSDVGIQVTPEDRERLAKSKFGEWFDEFFEKKFDEAMKKAASSQPRSQTPPQPQPDPGQTPEQPRRRRSLLEECFSQTFGF